MKVWIWILILVLIIVGAYFLFSGSSSDELVEEEEVSLDETDVLADFEALVNDGESDQDDTVVEDATDGQDATDEEEKSE